MPTHIKREIICPNCSKGQKMIMMTGVNNIQTPQYKEKILKEEFFDFKCNHCGYLAQMVYPIVYVDSLKNYIVALTPLESQEENLESNPKISELIKRKVKTVAELKEKILILDEGLNDVAIEMVKRTLYGVIKNTKKIDKLRMYFSKIDNEQNIEFVAFLGNDPKPVYETTNYMMYVQSVEVLRSIGYREVDKFLKVNSDFVKELLSENDR